MASAAGPAHILLVQHGADADHLKGLVGIGEMQGREDGGADQPLARHDDGGSRGIVNEKGDFRHDLERAAGEADMGDALGQRVTQGVQRVVLQEEGERCVAGLPGQPPIGPAGVDRHAVRIAEIGGHGLLISSRFAHAIERGGAVLGAGGLRGAISLEEALGQGGQGRPAAALTGLTGAGRHRVLVP